MKKFFILKCLADLFFLFRPILFVPVWGFCAFGYFRSKGGSLEDLYMLWGSTPVHIYLLILVFSFSVGVVYILNQISDVEVDKKNGGLPLLASGVVKVKHAWVFSLAVSAFLIILPLLIGYSLLSLFCATSIGIGLLYSFRPTYFSGRNILDFLTNAFGYGIIAFGVGYWIGGGDVLTSHFLIESLPYFFLMCAGSISSTLPDIEGDRLVNKKTTAVTLGIAKAHLLSLGFLILSLVTSFTNSDMISLLCSTLSLPIYILFLFRSDKYVMEATYKIGGALCMFAAFLIMPFFLIVSCCIFLITRYYFKARHGVKYPSMVAIHHEV